MNDWNDFSNNSNTTAYYFFQLASPECPIDVAKIWNIQLAEQPFTELNADAFREFASSGLYAVAFEFGALSVIKRDAFRGVENSLKELYLKNNPIDQVQK